MSIGPLSTIIDDKYNGNYEDWLKDFIVRVKKAYPKAVDIHQLLAQNNEIAGRFLDDMSSGRGNMTKRKALYTEWFYTYQRNGLQK